MPRLTATRHAKIKKKVINSLESQQKQEMTIINNNYEMIRGLTQIIPKLGDAATTFSPTLKKRRKKEDIR